MKLVIATDDDRAIIEYLAAHLRQRGHEATVMPKANWAAVASSAARRVAQGDYDQGIVCCWTGTGASIAANKVSGIRAALCTDAQTAVGARKWNDANVLALSLRLLSEALAVEILDAWLDTHYDRTEDESLAHLGSLESE